MDLVFIDLCVALTVLQLSKEAACMEILGKYLEAKEQLAQCTVHCLQRHARRHEQGGHGWEVFPYSKRPSGTAHRKTLARAGIPVRTAGPVVCSC